MSSAIDTQFAVSPTPTHPTIAGQLHVLTSGTVLCTPFVSFPKPSRPHEWNRAVHAIRSFSILSNARPPSSLPHPFHCCLA